MLFSPRFSHSPLIDEDDEEEEAKEPMLNEAFGNNSCLLILHFVRLVLLVFQTNETLSGKYHGY